MTEPVRLSICFTLGDIHGGSEAMLLRFLSNIDRARFAPDVTFFNGGSFPRVLAEDFGIPVRVVPEGQLRDPRTSAKVVVAVARDLRQKRPHVLLNFDTKAQVYGGLAAALSRTDTPVVWWQHVVPVAKHWLDRWATAVPAVAVGASSAAAARAQEVLSPTRTTFVVHPGIPVNAAEPATLDLPAGAFVVGMVARLQPWKGVHVVVDAIARLRAQGYDVHGLIVGGSAYGIDVDYAVQLREQVARAGLDDHITWTGHVDDAMPYMHHMDVVCNVSLQENLSQAILEAMSLSKPVLAVGDAGMAEVIKPLESGLLLRSHDDVDELTQTLRRVVEDDGLRQRLAAGARDRFLEEFTVETMVRRLSGQLESVARTGSIEVTA